MNWLKDTGDAIVRFFDPSYMRARSAEILMQINVKAYRCSKSNGPGSNTHQDKSCIVIVMFNHSNGIGCPSNDHS